eukprot:scaffold46445_cov59-Phaeocystis_antarctica.AAC.7
MSGRHRRGKSCRNPATACLTAAQCVPLVTGCHKRDGSRGWDECRSCHANIRRPGYAGTLTLVAARAPPPAQHGHVQRVPPQWEAAPWASPKCGVAAPWTRWRRWTEARAAMRGLAPPAGRGGWRCDRRRRREGGRGAGARYRTAGAPSRPAAAPCAPPAPSSPAGPPSVHLDQVRHDETNDQHALADQPNLAAEGDNREAVEQHEAYQPKLVPEP